jgi:hypothetical protein
VVGQAVQPVFPNPLDFRHGLLALIRSFPFLWACAFRLVFDAGSTPFWSPAIPNVRDGRCPNWLTRVVLWGSVARVILTFMDCTWNRRRFLTDATVAAFLRPQPSTAAAGKLRAGAATANITPALGCSLAGGMTDRRATEVHDELHVRPRSPHRC